MFLKPKEAPWRADSLVAVEIKLRYHPQIDKEPNGELVMMYVDSKTGVSFGTCPMKAHMMSDETRKALIAFLNSAESDFGRSVFESGTQTGTHGELINAESNKPLAGLGDT